MNNRIGCDGRENSLEPEDRQREDHQFVESFKPLVEFLGKVCGPLTEIALHDTAEPDNSIIAIANGGVSGRQVGSLLISCCESCIGAWQRNVIM